MESLCQDHKGLIQTHEVDGILIKTYQKLKYILNKTCKTRFKHCLIVVIIKFTIIGERHGRRRDKRICMIHKVLKSGS